MRIKKLTAAFGRLEGETLVPGPGLNIIEAPNEGGKSTWAGFWKAMLYGIDTRDRDRKGYLAEKNRYQPWSGAPMEGEAVLEWGGREITLRRGKRGTVPFAALNAVYTGTEELVPGLAGARWGEVLTGVSREVYERSAFIGQSGMALTSAPDLEKRIAALASSGEESVSYSQAEARLREWLNRRRVNKTVGLIPRLEEELEENRQALARLDQTASAIARGEEERLALERVKRELEWDLETYDRERRRELNQRFAQAQEELDAAQEELDALGREQARFGALPPREELKRAQGELQYLKVLDEEIKRGEAVLEQAGKEQAEASSALQDPLFQDMAGPEALGKAQEEASAVRTARENRKKNARRGWALLIPAAAAAAVWGLAWQLLTPARFVPALHGLLGAAAVLLALGLLALQRGGHWRRQEAAVLSRYGVKQPEELLALAQDYQRRWTEVQGKEQAVRNIQSGVEEHRTRRETCREALLDFVHAFAPEVRDLFGCSAALSRALGLEDALRSAGERAQLLRRRRDDLAAQGASGEDTLELRHPPRYSLMDTRARLSAAEDELERINRTLNIARGEQNAMGDPAALAARREALEEELARRRAEHLAISTALDALKAADARMQERFSPALNRQAGAWMEKLTGGRYASVSLSRELEASAARPEEVLPRRALALSQGTADQLYLAVRLAVSQLCLPQEDPAPLVLDDALASFDDERLGLALDCLARLGEERQILLFTCHGRERAALEGRKGVRFLSLSAPVAEGRRGAEQAGAPAGL